MTDVQSKNQEGIRQRQQQGKQSEHPAAEQLIRETKANAQQAYNKVCETCQSLGSYPKLMTVLLLLSAFCLGIGVTAMAGRMGYFVPSTGHFTRDQTAVEAHAALDTLLEQMNHYRGKASDMKSSALKQAAKIPTDTAKLSAAKEVLLNVMASKAGSWKDDLSERAANLKNKAYDAYGNIVDTDYAAKASGLAADAKESVLRAAARAGLAEEPKTAGLGDKILDGVHDLRDAANDAYYTVKGKVLGEAKEVEEGTIKRTLHKAENKIKDALHMN